MKGEYITFKNYQNKIKSTFAIYADFESILDTFKKDKIKESKI